MRTLPYNPGYPATTRTVPKRRRYLGQTDDDLRTVEVVGKRINPIPEVVVMAVPAAISFGLDTPIGEVSGVLISIMALHRLATGFGWV